MAEEIPEGLAIEPIWAIEATYGTDAAERRPAVRHEHLARIGRLRAAGTVIEAGGYADMSGSLLLVRAPDEAAALAIMRDDVYMRSGVWTRSGLGLSGASSGGRSSKRLIVPAGRTGSALSAARSATGNEIVIERSGRPLSARRVRQCEPVGLARLDRVRVARSDGSHGRRVARPGPPPSPASM